jgi:Cu(I)/Ag(I) efflux system membrane fusion protein
MDLTLVNSTGDGWEGDDPSIRLGLSENARKMADVGSVEVIRRELFKEIRTVGKVDLDETRVANVAARLRGPINELFADSPGTPVKKGDPLVSIFSTEVYPAQQEFIFSNGREVAARKLTPGTALNKFYLPRRRLEFWGMTEAQIDRLSQATEGSDLLEVCAPINGTIIEKNVRVGQFVQEGEVLYTIADLSQVWLVLDIYESDISWLRLGQAVQITLESEPQRLSTGKVGFIEPVLNEATRTVQVRVILENPDGRFKPGMYAQALLRIPVLSDGSPAPTGLEGKFLCPMHPYTLADTPGTCQRCRLTLEQIPGTPTTDPSMLSPLVLAIPAEAVLTTGRRQLAYQEVEAGQYQLVEPKLGARAGDYYPVIAGLEEGDRVVTRGSFLVDSQFQISGKSSLLYPRSEARAGVPEGLTAREWDHFSKLPDTERAAALAQMSCPGCNMNLGALGVPYRLEIHGRTVYLCCKGCATTVQKDPEAAFAKLAATRPTDTNTHDVISTDVNSTDASSTDGADVPTGDPLGGENTDTADDRQAANQQRICPPCGMGMEGVESPVRLEIEGRTVFLCGPGCADAVKQDSQAAFAKIDAAKAEAVK